MNFVNKKINATLSVLMGAGGNVGVSHGSDGTFIIECSGLGGTVSQTVNVDVTPPSLPTVSLSANASTI